MRYKTMVKGLWVIILVGVFSLCFTSISMANLKVIRIYKQTFPGEKPKCTLCHLDKTPKKAEGKHEHNAYGKKILKAKKELKKEKVDAEVLEKVGKFIKADE